MPENDSNVVTEEVTEDAAPLTIANVDLSSFGDETRIPEAEEYRGFMDKVWSPAVKRAVTEAKRYTGALKVMAQARVTARSFIVRANGFPDWAGDTDAYKRSLQVAENPLLAELDPDAKQRLGNAVKQHVKRTYMLQGVVSFVIHHEANFGDEQDAWNVDPSNVLGAPSEALKKRVREHYKANGLTLPDGPFQYAETNPSPPEQNDPENVLETLETALAGLAQILPRHTVAGLLMAATELSEGLIEGKVSDVEKRPQVIANLGRIATICTETAAYLGDQDGKHDDKALRAAYFNAKDKAAAAE